MTKTLSLPFAALALGALAACGQNDSDAKRTADDAFIVAQVRAKAFAVDAASVDLVHVSIDRGTITLSGKIANAGERQAIEDGARGVSGVRTVIDQIVVDPSAPTGAEIEADLALAGEVHTALVAQTGVNAARIHVDVHHGVVTLTGTLPTAAHKEVADETVRSMSGVHKLVDEITVESTASK